MTLVAISQSTSKKDHCDSFRSLPRSVSGKRGKYTPWDTLVMRLPLLASLIASAALSLPVVAADDDPLTVEGRFTVKAPAEGYKWGKAKDLDMGGSKGAVYIATKEGSASHVMLAVEYRTADVEGKKVAALKAHWNATVEGLRKAGNTDIKGQKPSLEPPVPDQVPHGVTFKTSAGKAMAYQSVTAFGKNIYLFRVVAESEEEAKKLAQVAKSLKE
jgi:hypothetical protein